MFPCHILIHTLERVTDSYGLIHLRIILWNHKQLRRRHATSFSYLSVPCFSGNSNVSRASCLAHDALIFIPRNWHVISNTQSIHILTLNSELTHKRTNSKTLGHRCRFYSSDTWKLLMENPNLTSWSFQFYARDLIGPLTLVFMIKEGAMQTIEVVVFLICNCHVAYRVASIFLLGP